MPKKKKRRLKMKDRKTNFDYDLVIGQKGEKLVDHIFKNATVEVKRDFWTGTTGNIAVEFESRGKPSGISKTKSDCSTSCPSFKSLMYAYTASFTACLTLD